MLANLLPPCVNTVEEGGTDLAACYVNTAREGGTNFAPCCDTIAVAGAGAARLTCSTVGTCSGRRRVSPVCLSSYCYNM